MKHFAIRLLLAMSLVAAATSLSHAQGGGTSSSLTGVVVDQTGAVIPGAEIAVKNNATGYEAKGISAENGSFTISFLPIGTYTATVNPAGLQTMGSQGCRAADWRPLYAQGHDGSGQPL